MPRSFTFVCQLYCCSSKHNNKALHITFNSCKTVSTGTSSMALATVNIDKIIKVTSASSYVYPNSTWLVTSRLDTTRSTCRVRRDEHVEPCCSTSSTQPKCMGSTRQTCCVVSRRDVMSHVRVGLISPPIYRVPASVLSSVLTLKWS